MHQIAPMSEDQAAIKAAVEKTLEPFGDDYWAKTDETGDWPEEFCDAMAAGGWLGIAFPEEYGGAGLGLTEAALMMQTVTRTGAGYSTFSGRRPWSASAIRNRSAKTCPRSSLARRRCALP